MVPRATRLDRILRIRYLLMAAVYPGRLIVGQVVWCMADTRVNVYSVVMFRWLWMLMERLFVFVGLVGMWGIRVSMNILFSVGSGLSTGLLNKYYCWIWLLYRFMVLGWLGGYICWLYFCVRVWYRYPRLSLAWCRRPLSVRRLRWLCGNRLGCLDNR